MPIVKLILHYDTLEQTLRLASMVPDAIIVDNGSKMDITDYVSNAVLRYPTNLGFTRNWNRVLKDILPKYKNQEGSVWLMNSDIEIGNQSVERIEQIMKTGRYDMITPAYNCWMNQCKNNGSPGIRKVHCIEFTAPVIRFSVFEQIGMFDERFALGYGVELDWALRMERAGLKQFCDDQSVFYHHGQQTINTIGTLSDYEHLAKIELDNGMTTLYGPSWRQIVETDLAVCFGKKKKKKIAVYTTIFGNYDQLKSLPTQTIEADYFCITDLENEITTHCANLPGEQWRMIPVAYPNNELSPRMRAKYFKMFPWEVATLAGYETVIYIDSSIKVTSDQFVRFCVDSCVNDMALYAHPQRDCIYEEAKASLSLIKYRSQGLTHQISRYHELYPPNAGLWACGIMVRKIHSPIIRALMKNWWWENVKWTFQDQISFPVVCKMMNYQPDTIPGNQYKNSFFKVIWHDDNPLKALNIHAN